MQNENRTSGQDIFEGQYVESGIKGAHDNINKLILESMLSNIRGAENFKFGEKTTSDLPDIFKGTEGRKNRAVLQKLFNIVLKDRSGAAVTEPELDRLKEEFSSGLFKTDQDYINAFKIYKRILNNTISQAKAAYDPRAFDRWVGQGGKWQVGSNQELRNQYD